MEKKSQHILKAIAAGQSCEKILARDNGLTYHDIFHAVTEAPTTYWRKAWGKNALTRLEAGSTFIRRPWQSRVD